MLASISVRLWVPATTPFWTSMMTSAVLGRSGNVVIANLRLVAAVGCSRLFGGLMLAAAEACDEAPPTRDPATGCVEISCTSVGIAALMSFCRAMGATIGRTMSARAALERFLDL